VTTRSQECVVEFVWELSFSSLFQKNISPKNKHSILAADTTSERSRALHAKRIMFRRALTETARSCAAAAGTSGARTTGAGGSVVIENLGTLVARRGGAQLRQLQPLAATSSASFIAVRPTLATTTTTTRGGGEDAPYGPGVPAGPLSSTAAATSCRRRYNTSAIIPISSSGDGGGDGALQAGSMMTPALIARLDGVVERHAEVGSCTRSMQSTHSLYAPGDQTLETEMRARSPASKVCFHILTETHTFNLYRYAKLCAILISNPPPPQDEMMRVNKELSRVEKVVTSYAALCEVRDEMKSLREMLAGSSDNDDDELIVMAREEHGELAEQMPQLEEDLAHLLLPSVGLRTLPGVRFVTWTIGLLAVISE
jgi:hypothetical protein